MKTVGTRKMVEVGKTLDREVREGHSGLQRNEEEDGHK